MDALLGSGEFSWLSIVILLLSAVTMVIAITIHEFCHAWAADRLGDPNPRLQGRLTLNPLKHLDPVGTISLVLFGFGWGKPVQFDPYNLKDRRRDSALIAAAGPASNLILALICSLLLRLVLFLAGANYSLIILVIDLFLSMLISINVVLAVFNLIPVPPLDGSHILSAFLPPKVAISFNQTFRRFGPFILLFLVLPIFGQSSLVGLIVSPISDFLLNFLIP